MATGYTPIYRVYRGGVDITDKFNDRTSQIKVELTAGGGEGDRCDIFVDDRDWAIDRPFPGEQLGIYLGYQEVGLSFMGTFTIDEVHFKGMPKGIQLSGSSTGFNDMKKAPQIANWGNKSVADILGEIAGQAGLGMSISEGAGSLMLPFKNQVISNLHLIHELERLTGSVGKIVDGNLMFVPRDGTNSASGVALPTLILQPEHFGTWDVKHTQAPEYSGVKAAWWDKENHIRKFVESGVKGAGGAGDVPFMVGQLFNSEAEAQAAAQSKAQGLKRAEVKAVFDLAKGDPWIRDQQTIYIIRMRDGVNGSYVVDKAIHTYLRSTGIKTNLQCTSPGDESDYGGRSADLLLKPLPGEPMGTAMPDDL